MCSVHWHWRGTQRALRMRYVLLVNACVAIFMPFPPACYRGYPVKHVGDVLLCGGRTVVQFL